MIKKELEALVKKQRHEIEQLILAQDADRMTFESEKIRHQIAVDQVTREKGKLVGEIMELNRLMKRIQHVAESYLEIRHGLEMSDDRVLQSEETRFVRHFYWLAGGKKMIGENQCDERNNTPS